MSRSRKYLCLITFLTLLSPLGTPASEDLAQQRALYVEAEQALQRGRLSEFEGLRLQLRDYPLYPYLVYAELLRRLSQLSAEEVRAFAVSYADTPLAERLSTAYLLQLGRQRQWQAYLLAYRDEADPELQCYHLRALYNTGKKEAALAVVQPLWLVDRSQPKACDPLFDAWREAGRLTSGLAWERFRLAMHAGNAQLARYLIRFMAGEEKHLAEIWYQVRRDPALAASHPALKDDRPMHREIIAYAIKRLARLDSARAQAEWDRLNELYRFDESQRLAVERRIVLNQLLEREPEALQRVDTVGLDARFADVQEWRVRTALSLQDWEASLAWLARLPAGEQDSERWRYWRGRALQQQGERSAAEGVFTELAQLRNYYGFLAADRLGRSYQLNNLPLTYGASELAALEHTPGVLRARELFLLGKMIDARREWYHSTRNMDDVQLAQVAKLAQHWGWHDQAITTVARTPYLDDLELRFPLPYQDYVNGQAAQQRIDPAWVFAIMRQESAFTPDVRSPAGALGLMQLMPRTGQDVAKSLQTRLTDTRELLDAKTNIRFGVAHLRQVLSRFADNMVLATAAYNAGQGRIQRWIPEQGGVEADLWIETLPIAETRNYLKNVLAYTVVYDYRLGHESRALKSRMPQIARGEPSAAPARQH